METPLSRLEAVQAKYTELLAKMKRLDQENAKNKKRGDLFQKEKEAQRSELTKTVSMKEKLEKLCRELTRENKKIKVRMWSFVMFASLSKLVISLPIGLSISVLTLHLPT